MNQAGTAVVRITLEDLTGPEFQNVLNRFRQVKEMELDFKRQAMEMTRQANTFLGAIGNWLKPLARVSAEILAIKYGFQIAGQGIVGVFVAALKPIEDLEQTAIRVAAEISSLQPPGANVAKIFAMTRDYVKDLVTKLDEMTAQLAPSTAQAMILVDEMAKLGIVVGNDAEGMKAFRNIANATYTIARSYGQVEIQMRQEIRALMQGEVNLRSQLATQVNAMLGGQLKPMLAIWRQQHTEVKEVGKLLVGWNEAAQKLENTFGSIGSTLVSFKDLMMRGLFGGDYEALVEPLARYSTALITHRKEILMPFRDTWILIKEAVMSAYYAIQSVINIVPGLQQFMKNVFPLLAKSLEGWAGIFAYIENSMKRYAKFFEQMGANPLQYINYKTVFENWRIASMGMDKELEDRLKEIWGPNFVTPKATPTPPPPGKTPPPVVDKGKEKRERDQALKDWLQFWNDWDRDYEDWFQEYLQSRREGAKADYDITARQIKSQSALLDLQVQYEHVQPIEVLKQRYLLEKQRLESQLKYQNIALKWTDDTLKGESDRVRIEGDIVETTQGMVDTQRNYNYELGQMQRLEQSWEAFKNKWTQLGIEANNAGKQAANMAETVAQSMTDSFSTFFFDAMQHKFHTLKEYIFMFLNDISRLVSQQLAEQAVFKGIPWVIKAFGATGGGGGGNKGMGISAPLPGGEGVPLAKPIINMNVYTKDAPSFKASQGQIIAALRRY